MRTLGSVRGRDALDFRAMCGRFTLKTPVAEIAEIFGVEGMPEADLPARYNIAPTQPVAVVRGAGEGDVRELALLRWGLLPGWVKDPEDWPTLINARAETLGRKPAFEDALRFRRCLVPADGFYEWRRERGGKQPYYVRRADDRPMAFAGLWERWTGSDDAVESCTIVTTDANPLLAPLHDRMPAILDAEAQARWMDPRLRSAEALGELLRPFPSERLLAYPVGRAVNRADADGPACIEALADREEWRGRPPASERKAGRARDTKGRDDAEGDGEAGAGEAGDEPSAPAEPAPGSGEPGAREASRQLELF